MLNRGRSQNFQNLIFFAYFRSSPLKSTLPRGFSPLKSCWYGNFSFSTVRVQGVRPPISAPSLGVQVLKEAQTNKQTNKNITKQNRKPRFMIKKFAVND